VKLGEPLSHSRRCITGGSTGAVGCAVSMVNVFAGMEAECCPPLGGPRPPRCNWPSGIVSALGANCPRCVPAVSVRVSGAVGPVSPRLTVLPTSVRPRIVTVWLLDERPFAGTSTSAPGARFVIGDFHRRGGRAGREPCVRVAAEYVDRVSAGRVDIHVIGEVTGSGCPVPSTAVAPGSVTSWSSSTAFATM